MRNKLIVILFSIIICLFITSLVSASWDAGLNNGLKGYWKLDSQTGGITPDSLGLNNGSLVNSPAVNVTGIIGNSSNYSSALNQKIDLGTETNWDTLLDGQHNVTISFWASQIDDGVRGSEGFVCKGQEPEYFCIRKDNAVDNGKLMVHLKGTSDISVKTSNEVFPADNVLRHVVLVYNGTGSGGIAIWVNGTYQPLTITGAGTTTIASNENLNIGRASENTLNHFLNGRVDELAIWDRALTNSEIAQLYNAGTGITYSQTFIITLNSPANNNVSLSNTNIFNITSNDTLSVGLKNITLFINGASNETKTISNFINESIFTKSLAVGNYTWNIQVCNINDNCENSTTRNLNVTNVIINSVSYNSSVQSGSTQSFILNVSSTGINSANFTYDNNIYTPSILTNGQESIISYSLSVPSGVGTKIFNWSLELSAGGTYNTANYNQIASSLNFDDCSVFTNKIINLSLKDEKLQSFLTIGGNTTIEVSLVIYPLNNYENPSFLIANISKTFNSNNGTICMNSSISSNYYMDVQIRYFDSGYAVEQYNIKKYLLSNSTAQQNITLFDLASAQSTEFLITFKNENYLPVKNALIEITRKYVGEGGFKTVEIPITDAQGQAKGHFDLDAIYTINIIKDNVILATYDNIVVSCQNPLLQDCKLNLNEPSIIPAFQNYTQFGGLSYNFYFNLTSRKITLIYSTVSGQTINAKLNATLLDRFGNSSVCNDALTSSAGTLTCIVPTSYGNGTIIARFYSNGNIVSTQVYSFGQNPRSYFGNDWIFILLMFCTTIPLILMPDPVLLLIGCVVSIVISFGLLLIMGGSLLGVGGFLVYFIAVVVLLIWKISKIRNG